MIKHLIILLTLFSYTTASAGGSSVCVDIFRKENTIPATVIPENVDIAGIRLIRDSAPQEVTSKDDPRYEESLKNMLEMLTEAKFQSISKKETQQKGELRLGKVFDDGLSLEFVYDGDIRGDEQAFNLKKIEIVKPNGQSETIEKNPLPDSGFSSKPKTYFVSKERSRTDDGVTSISMLDKSAIEKWAKDVPAVLERVKDNEDFISSLVNSSRYLDESNRQKLSVLVEQLKTVSVPHKIEGILLTGLLKWADRIPNLERAGMRDLLEKDQLTRLVWTSRARSSVRFMTDRLRKILFGDIVRYSIILGLGAHFLASNANPTQPQKTVATTEQIAQSTNAQLERTAAIDLVAEMIRKENERRGSALIYTGSSAHAGLPLTVQSRDAKILVSLFPSQQKILIMPSESSSKAIIINRQENPNVYDSIALRLENLYSRR